MLSPGDNELTKHHCWKLIAITKITITCAWIAWNYLNKWLGQLTHWKMVTYTCVSKLFHHWFGNMLLSIQCRTNTEMNVDLLWIKLLGTKSGQIWILMNKEFMQKKVSKCLVSPPPPHTHTHTHTHHHQKKYINKQKHGFFFSKSAPLGLVYMLFLLNTLRPRRDGQHFPKAFCNKYEFLLRFHSSFFPTGLSTIFHHWLGADQATILFTDTNIYIYTYI